MTWSRRLSYVAVAATKSVSTNCQMKTLKFNIASTAPYQVMRSPVEVSSRNYLFLDVTSEGIKHDFDTDNT